MSKQNIYHEELKNLQNSKSFLEEGNYSKIDLKNEFKTLCINYEDILGQIKIITRISDRLQGRLNKTNDQLNEKNTELQKTISELVKTRISRKATTIVFIIAIALFLIVEAVIEPYIEIYTSFYTALFIKLLIALMIKPAEMLLEHSFMKKERKRKIIN